MEKGFALVAEGGGQRGIFTAGVLDHFLDEDFNPFDIGCGVSAGAQNLLAYFLGQPGYARRAIAELTGRPDFLVPYRWLTAQSILDLDGYFETSVRDPEFRLPYQRLSRLQRQKLLQFVVTDKETLEALYLEPDETTVLDYMKASSAIPFLYRAGVPFGDRLLIDGGVSDPLPVKHVYDQGARKVVLIRTVPMPSGENPAAPDPDDESLWRQRLLQVRRLSGKSLKLPVKVLDMLACHEAALNRATAFICNPPEDLDLFVIAPQKTLKSQVFGSRSPALLEDYRSGIEAGRTTLVRLRQGQQVVREPVEGTVEV
ncbi:MAG: patatin family protein [Granulosicoccus sp.]|nr:patatin family protein [Granulosicoccus sp.]